MFVVNKFVRLWLYLRLYVWFESCSPCALQVGFDELGGKDDFSTEELEERLAKAEVIFFDGESSSNQSKAQTKRSVRQTSKADSSDSE